MDQPEEKKPAETLPVEPGYVMSPEKYRELYGEQLQK